MKFLTIFLFLACLAISALGANREIKQKVASLDPKIKASVMAMKSQGIPKHVIADKIKMSVQHDGNMQNVVDGITEEAERKSSPAAKQSKKRQTDRNAAVKKQARVEKKDMNKAAPATAQKAQAAQAAPKKETKKATKKVN